MQLEEKTILGQRKPVSWRHGFGVDALIPNLGVFRPRRDQPPAEHDEFACRGCIFR
jgi:hypothetical protein